MNELIRKETMTSLEIADVTGKRHDAVLRDIRNLLSQGIDAHNFVETSYVDKSNRQQKCFSLTKKGCLILASGYDALLREKIINRWEELEIKEQQGLSGMDIFERKLKAASWVADFLNMSNISKLILAKAVTSEFDLPLPDYVPSEGVVHSADFLLKKHNVGKSSIAFNKELVKFGYLREEQRPKKNGKLSKFKVITDKGLAFGRNDINEKNTNETHPRWYDDKFEELLSHVGLSKQQTIDLK